jgi:DNA-binding XRE family transcriptional regulator
MCNTLSESGLAKLLGVSQQAVQRIEAGIAHPSLDMAGRISRALHAAPCAAFPELAAACAFPPILRASDFPDQEHSAYSAADCELQIEGADPDSMDYRVADDGARRIQQWLARYNSGTGASSGEFLVFTTSSRVVAVHLSLIDQINLKYRPGADPLRKKPPATRPMFVSF